jgi:hypothetical protein
VPRRPRRGAKKRHGARHREAEAADQRLGLARVGSPAIHSAIEPVVLSAAG